MSKIGIVSILAAIMLALAAMAAHELTKEAPTQAMQSQEMATAEANIDATPSKEASNTKPSSEEKESKAEEIKENMQPAQNTALAEKSPLSEKKEDKESPKEGASGVVVPLDQGTVREDAEIERRKLPSTEEIKEESARPTEAANAESAQDKAQDPAPKQDDKQDSTKAEALAQPQASAMPAPSIPPKEPLLAESAEAPKNTENPEALESPKPNTRPAEELVVMISNAPKRVADGQGVITRMRLEVGPRRLALRFIGDTPLKAKYFSLFEPDRFVIDLQGNWALELPRIPKNTLLNKFRLGKQGDNTRLVLDLNRQPNSADLVQINENTIEVRLY